MKEALAVDDSGGIERGNFGDGDGLLGGVEVDYFLGVALEGEDDGVSREDGEVGVELLRGS